MPVMYTLYHLWLSPPCRLVRLVLEEKGLNYKLKAEKVWERRPDFLKLNPAGEVPVLVVDEKPLAGFAAILEFLEETAPNPALLPPGPAARAEVRRLVEWFLFKFNREVSDPLLSEKILKQYLKLGAPETEVIRAGQANLGHHMRYLAHLAERRNYLAGNEFSLADLAAAAQLSTADYLGEVDWPAHPAVREWYAKVKSRKSFRPLLKDCIAGMRPPDHYTSLDF